MIECFTKQQHISNADISVLKKHINGSCYTHWHEFYQIEYIIDGCGEYQIDGNIYTIQKGMLFFMTPINFHEIKNADTDIINIMFSPSFTSPDALFSILGHGIEHAVQFDKDIGFVESLLDELNGSVKQNDVSYSISLLNSLLFKLARKTNISSDIKLTYVQSVMLYVQNNFRSELTLNDVAEFAGLSPSYLSSIFSKEAGIGFKEYLSSLRYEYAKKLLLYSDMSVSEICFDAGFEDYANFMRGFKQRYGISPGKFRINKKY